MGSGVSSNEDVKEGAQEDALRRVQVDSTLSCSGSKRG